jgi:hypothetical protein
MIALTHVACLPDRQIFGKCDIGKLANPYFYLFEALGKNSQIAELRDPWDQGALIKALMKEYGLSKASVYRYLSSTVSA